MASGAQITRPGMDINRRQVLAGIAATGIAAAGQSMAQAGTAPDMAQAGTTSPVMHAGMAPGAEPRFLAARRHGTRHEAVLLDATGHDLAVLALPDRGHSFAIDAARERAVVFGRQPGFFALAFSLRDGALLGSLALPADRHFFGHGVFSADGHRLFATENDFDQGRGVIGIYDARPGMQWQRLGEFDSGGIGPHEVVLLPDQRTLAVANGGLLTHPDYDKTPLNLATMRPSLAYLDAQDGRLRDNLVLPAALFQLSIRHLALDQQGAVWFGCQHQGPATEHPPLVGRHRPGQAVELLQAPREIQRGLRNYIGSIAADPRQGLIATSSPVGGHIAWWRTSEARCVGSTARADVCGVAALDAGRFLVSDGFGGLAAAGPGRTEASLLPAMRELAWDNHLRRT